MKLRSRLGLQGVTKEVVVLSGPLILQNLSFTLLGVTDTFFVSRVSTEAVAAVGLAGVIFFALMLFFRTTANSSVVFVGRAHGAQDDVGVGKAIWNVLNMIALLSILSLGLPWLFTFIFGLAAPENDPILRELGTRYLQIRAFEVPLVMFNAVVWGFLVGRNDSRTPMLLAWLQVAVNIALDWCLVLGNLGFPALGVSGAAYATVAANAVVSLVSAYLLWRPTSRQRYETHKVRRASLQELRSVLRIGLPMGLGDFVEVSSFSMFFAIIGRLGTDILAANNIALQYMSISFTVGMAIGQATSSLVAQHLGAKESKLAERVAHRASVLAMILMGLIGLSYLIAPSYLIGIFSDNPDVIRAGVIILQLVAFYQVFDGAAIVLGGALNGAGDTTFTMLSRLIFAWGVFIPLSWVFAFPLAGGIQGAWIAAMIYLSGLGLIYFVRFRSGKWKSLSLD